MTVVVSWYNQIKVIEFIYNENEKKYRWSEIAKKTITIDNIFIQGSSWLEVDGNKNRFISL